MKWTVCVWLSVCVWFWPPVTHYSLPGVCVCVCVCVCIVCVWLLLSAQLSHSPCVFAAPALCLSPLFSYMRLICCTVYSMHTARVCAFDVSLVTALRHTHSPFMHRRQQLCHGINVSLCNVQQEESTLLIVVFFYAAFRLFFFWQLDMSTTARCDEHCNWNKLGCEMIADSKSTQNIAAKILSQLRHS